MRHIHDGELHAFLDGALDLLPEGRGDEIREHLNECSACRERLQDEEAIRTEAGDLFGEPDLGSVALPSFEEMRQLADAPAPEVPMPPVQEEKPAFRHRGPLKGLPLAWAATIVLALGVGWMGGQVWESLPSRTLPGGPVQSQGEGLPLPAPAEAGSLLEVEAEALPTSEDAREDLGLAPEGLGRIVSEAPSPPTEIQEGSSSETEEVPASLKVAADPEASIPGAVLPSPSDPGNVVAETSLAQEARRTEAARSVPVTRGVPDSIAAAPVTINASETAERQRIAIRSDSTPLGAAALSAAAGRTKLPESPTDALFSVTAPWEEVVDASAVETASLAVPGLEVLSTEWEERVPGEKALLIRQLVAPGDTLELRYLGLLLGTDPDPEASRDRTATKETGTVGRVYANVLAASLPPGWQQVVMERERGLVVARGPFAEPHLKSLLKRIR